MTTYRLRAGMALVCVLCACVAGCAQAYRITAAADPMRLVFDAQSENRVTITVYVRDAAGQTAPERTPVLFYSSLGTLGNTVAYTDHGQAIMLLSNIAGPGRAQIDVTVGDARQTLYVDFLGQGAGTSEHVDRPRHTLNASRVYYSMDQQVFDLCSGAVFTGPGFTVNADLMQYRVADGVLAAQNNVVVRAGDKSLTGRKLTMRVAGGSGCLAQVTADGVKFLEFNTSTMDGQETDAARMADYKGLDPNPTRTWVVARRAVVFPGEMIQFNRPEFYLDTFDKKLYALPNHVIDLGASQTGMLFSSEISLTSDAGLNVDFPIYYAAGADRLGALHVRHVTKGSPYYKGHSGVQLSINEEYLIGQHTDGAITMDDLTSGTRGVRWDHRTEIGSTYLTANASYDRMSDTTPYTSRVSLGASRPASFGHLSLSAYWSGFQGNQDSTSELTATLPSDTLGGTGITVAVSPYVGFSRQVVAAKSAPTLSNDALYTGARATFGIPSARLLGGTLNTNLSNEVSFDEGGILTEYADASLSFRRPITRSLNTTISYSANYTTANKVMENQSGQRVGLDLSGQKFGMWDLYGFGSYTIDSDAIFASGAFTYNLPWFRDAMRQPRTYVRYNASMMKGETSTTQDHLFSLGWRLGAYSVVAHYSPTGNTSVTGIGTGTGRHWAVELVRASW